MVTVFVQNATSTTGAGLTGLTYNASGLEWYWFAEDSGTSTSISLTNMTLGTWTSGGFAADSLEWIKKAGTPLTGGYVALQAESHPVEFRKVELLNLEGCMDKNALNYKSYYIKADNSKCKYK